MPLMALLNTRFRYGLGLASSTPNPCRTRGGCEVSSGGSICSSVRLKPLTQRDRKKPRRCEHCLPARPQRKRGRTDSQRAAHAAGPSCAFWRVSACSKKHYRQVIRVVLLFVCACWNSIRRFGCSCSLKRSQCLVSIDFTNALCGEKE